jgi:hypothetical protein
LETTKDDGRAIKNIRGRENVGEILTTTGSQRHLLRQEAKARRWSGRGSKQMVRKQTNKQTKKLQVQEQ